MAVCDQCGNDYDKTFDVVFAGKTYTFDSFECAIHMLAPTCNYCGVRMIGHGAEANGSMYCCARCAAREGVTSLKDRTEEQPA